MLLLHACGCGRVLVEDRMWEIEKMPKTFHSPVSHPLTGYN